MNILQTPKIVSKRKKQLNQGNPQGGYPCRTDRTGNVRSYSGRKIGLPALG
jgi:hypothetical protein